MLKPLISCLLNIKFFFFCSIFFIKSDAIINNISKKQYYYNNLVKLLRTIVILFHAGIVWFFCSLSSQYTHRAEKSSVTWKNRRRRWIKKKGVENHDRWKKKNTIINATSIRSEKKSRTRRIRKKNPTCFSIKISVPYIFDFLVIFFFFALPTRQRSF